MTLQEIVNAAQTHMKSLDDLFQQAKGMTDQMTPEQQRAFRKAYHAYYKAHHTIAEAINEDGGDVVVLGGST